MQSVEQDSNDESRRVEEACQEYFGVTPFGVFCKEHKFSIDNERSFVHHIEKHHPTIESLRGQNIIVSKRKILCDYFKKQLVMQRQMEISGCYVNFVDFSKAINRMVCSTCGDNYASEFFFKRHLKKDGASHHQSKGRNCKNRLCTLQNSRIITGRFFLTVCCRLVSDSVIQEKCGNGATKKRELENIGYQVSIEPAGKRKKLVLPDDPSIPDSLCMEPSSVHSKIVAYVREDECAETYSSILHTVLVEENFPDNVRFMMDLMKPKDDANNPNIALVMNVAKKWLFDYANLHIQRIPANIRACILTFDFKENGKENDSSGGTFQLRSNLDKLWIELQKLLLMGMRTTSVILQKEKEEIGRIVLSKTKSEVEKMKECIKSALIPRMLVKLVYEETENYAVDGMVVRMAMARCFRTKQDNVLLLRECGNSAGSISSILHVLRAGLCGWLVGCKGPDLQELALQEAAKLNRSRVVNVLSPLICYLRSMSSSKPPRKDHSVNGMGDITTGSFVIPHEMWRGTVTKFLEKLTSLFDVSFENKEWTRVLQKEMEMEVHDWKHLKVVFVCRTAEAPSGDCAIDIENLMVSSPDVSEKEMLVDKMCGLFELAFHGFGLGALRHTEVQRMKLFQCRIHGGKLYYYNVSIKKGNCLLGTKGNRVEHCLPRVVTRLFVLFRKLLKDWKYEAHGKVIPAMENRLYDMSKAAMNVYDLHKEPTYLELRHLWTSISNVVFPQETSQGKLTTTREVALQSGHSTITHSRFYSTYVEDSIERKYQRFHEAIGDEIRASSVIGWIHEVRKSEMHQAIKLIYGRDAVFRCNVQEEMVEACLNQHACHMHLSIPCGYGKSLSYVIPTVTDRMQGSKRRMRIVIVPYKFLLAHAWNAVKKHCSCVSDDIEIRSYHGEHINKTTFPEELKEDDLPGLILLSLEAAASLFTDHIDLVMKWSTAKILKRIYLDEVHTVISEQRFRKAYEQLKNFSILNVPVTTMSGSMCRRLLPSITSYFGLSENIDEGKIQIHHKDGVLGENLSIQVTEVNRRDMIKDAVKVVCNYWSQYRKSVHVICSTVQETMELGEIIRRECNHLTSMVVTSQTDSEEQERISKEWYEGNATVLISTTVALVGNENPMCGLIVIVNYLYNISSVVQAIGRLRPEQRGKEAVVHLVIPLLNQTERERYRRLDSTQFRQLVAAGILEEEQQENYNRLYSYCELITILSRKDCCYFVLFSNYFEEECLDCGRCTNCEKFCASMLEERYEVPDHPTLIEIDEARSVLENSSLGLSFRSALSQTVPSFQTAKLPALTSQSTHQSGVVEASINARKRLDKEKKMKENASELLQLLQRKCLVCGRESCSGDGCIGGCYNCGDKRHRSSHCYRVKEKYLTGKGCYHCYEKYKILGRRSHDSPHCPLKKRLLRLMLDHYWTKLKMTSGDGLEDYMSKAFASDDQYISLLNTLSLHGKDGKNTIRSNGPLIIKCWQIEEANSKAPLLPPTLIRPLQGAAKRVELRGVQDARETYRAFRKMSDKSKKTKCHYLHGSRHEFLYENCHDILDIDELGDFDLDIKIQRKNQDVETTILKVRRTFHDSLLTTISALGEEYWLNNAGTIRGHRKDGGKMWLMGCYGVKEGKQLYSKMSRKVIDKVVQWRKLTTVALSELFPKEVEHIREENNKKKVLLGDDECCAAGILSQDLSNSMHIDLDEYLGIVVFSELIPGHADNWYFILSNVTRDGERAIVIKKTWIVYLLGWQEVIPCKLCSIVAGWKSCLWFMDKHKAMT